MVLFLKVGLEDKMNEIIEFYKKYYSAINILIMFFSVLICPYLIGIYLYFLPSLVGWNKKNITAIFLLNLLLGWTVLGWVIALIWSTTKD